MHSILILRRDPIAARAAQAAIEATRDLRVAAVCSTLYEARKHLALRTPDALLTDLSLHDGAAMSLLAELRRSAPTRERPKVLLVVSKATDALLFGTLSAGADSYMIDMPGAPSLPSALRCVLQGEAALSAPLARQMLAFFGVASKASAAQERALDWSRGALDPLQLSRGEQHLLALFAQGEPLPAVATRLGVSIESIGRRATNLYRKLQWDLRSGSLSLQTL